MKEYQIHYILKRLDILEEKMNDLLSSSKLETYFTIKEIAESLKVKPITIQRKVNEGSLQAIKIGNEYRISKKDLEHYLFSSELPTT